MAEPPAKKAKVELSDVSEPLTQTDVILFQKEALFRSLNKYKTEAKLSYKQILELKQRQDTCSERLASVCGAVRAMARILGEGAAGEEEAVCRRITEGTEDDVVEGASKLAKLVFRRLERELDTGSIHWDRWRDVEVLYAKLQSENERLTQEVVSVKEFYADLLRKYDREDSLTVKRVFKVDEKEASTARRGSPPVGVDASEGEKPASEKSGSAAEDGETQKGTLEGVTKQNGSGAKSQMDVIPQVAQELRIADFESQIQILENTVRQLTDWKSANEHELIRLRQELSLAGDEQQHATNAGAARWESAPEIEALNSKIEKLMQENRELSQVNEAYLNKFQRLSSDREVFTNKLSSEFQTAQETLKKHNSALEKDLVRIRTARDELLSKIAVLESHKSKSDMLKDLESMLEIQQEQLHKMSECKVGSASQDVLMIELKELEKAFKELSQYSNKKYSEYLNQESLISKLTVEKTKADQKYFAAMRSKDSILIENKNLSKNLSKSNELIQQLKDIEKTLQSKIENLSKQLQVSQLNEKRLIDSNKVTSLKMMDLTSQLTRAKKSSAAIQQELSKCIEDKVKLELKLQSYEMEVSNLQLKLTYQENKSSKLQKTLISNGGDSGALAEELENFRTVVYCSLCSKNWRDTAIKTCGHVFCADCCKERLAARMRKCPTCNKAFSFNDLLVVHL